VLSLEELYLWNIREGTAQGRRILTYNLYYATAPAVDLPSAPTDPTTTVDYDFSSDGWTKVNTGGALTLAQRGSQPDPANGVIDLSGIAARYVAVEILTNAGDANRTGLAEVGITYVPPPDSTVLIIR